MYQNVLKLAASAALLLGVAACGPKQNYEYPFQNPKLSTEDRVENLMSLLTPEENFHRSSGNPFLQLVE